MKRLLPVLFLLLAPGRAAACDPADSLATPTEVLNHELYALGPLLAVTAPAAPTPPTPPTPRARPSAPGRVTVRSSSPVVAGEDEEQATVKKTVPARADAVVIVHNPNGSIRLIGWARPEVAISCTLDRSISRLRASGLDDSSEIRIEVEPKGMRFFPPGIIVTPAPRPTAAPSPAPSPAPAPGERSNSRERAKLREKLAEVDRLASRERARERARGKAEEAEWDALAGPGAPEAEIEVYLPRLARLTVETFGADVSTTGLSGNIDVSSLSGNLELEGQFRRIDAECVTCDIQAGSTIEAFKASTVSGNITLEMAQGYVELNTVSGDVELTGQRLSQGTFTSVSGNLVYKGDVQKDGALYFETHDGAIELQLPRNLGAEFDLSSIMGSVSSDLQSRPSESMGSRGGRQVRFVTLAGGGRISARSFGGDITVTGTKK